MPQLDPTWFVSQLFWLAICFATLYFMLSKLVLPPLVEILAKRSETLAGDIEAAQVLKAQAEQARLDYEKTMAEARNQAQELVNSAVAEQKAKAEAKGRELEGQIEQKLSSASAQLLAQKEKLVQELAPAVTDIAHMIVEKLTQGQASEQAKLTGTKGRR